MHRELREHWAECSNLRNRDKCEEFIEEEEIDSDYQAVKSIEMEFGEDESWESWLIKQKSADFAMIN